MEANKPGLKRLLADAEMKWDFSLSECKVMLFQVATNREKKKKKKTLPREFLHLKLQSLPVFAIPCMSPRADAALPGASPGPELITALPLI